MTTQDTITAIVSRADLESAHGALKRMLGRKKNGGDGTFRFDADGAVTISWANSEESVPGQVVAAASVEAVVDNSFMLKFTDLLPQDASVDVFLGLTCALVPYGSRRESEQASRELRRR